MVAPQGKGENCFCRMEIIQQSHQILDELNQDQILKKIELCGRTAYKSEEKITPSSAEKFVKSIISRGHESVIEHVNITVKFITDRGVSHELVRHRLVSYTQESTRYVNYSKHGMTVIEPLIAEGSFEYILWLNRMRQVEQDYNELIKSGAKPEEARCILPNCLKTEIVTTANLREWRHILKLRTSKEAHPQIRELMLGLLREFKEKLPIIFDDVHENCYIQTKG